MRIKLELTLKSRDGSWRKDLAIEPKYIDTDEPMDGISKLYDDLLHYTEVGRLDIAATLVD
jgi:hypothetical protein